MQNEMRDRLIEILDKTFAEQYEKRRLLTATHTAEYLLKNGVIVPPCKVGDVAYILSGFSVIERKVTGFQYSTDMTKLNRILIDLVTDKEGNTNTFYFSADKINKSIFFTREEAEKALKEGVYSADL